MIREGLWVQLWGSDESDGADLTPPSPTPAGVAEGEGITLEELGKSVKIPLNEDEGLFDEEGNCVAGSDYEMSVGGSEAGADIDMKIDEDREEAGMEASRYAPGAKGKEKEGEEGKGNESMAQEGLEWQWEVADSRDRAALVRDINWWGERLARFKRKDGNLAGEKARWRKLAMDQIKATGELIEAGADMEVERAEPQEHGGWLCLTKWADRIPGIRKREAFSEEIGRVKGFYDMVNRVENEGQMRDMVKIMQRMEESMELVKGKLGVGTIEEIERAKKVEERKKREAEEKRRMETSKAEGIRKARAQKLMEEKRGKAEEAAMAEEKRQEEERTKKEETLKFQREELERLVKERSCMGSTCEETMTWAERMSKGKETLQKLEDESKRPSQEVSTGSGWEVKEGKTMRTVEITSHFWSPLTEEEKKSLPEKVRTVGELIDTGRKIAGKGSWTIKALVDLQVCFNEITWTVSKVVTNTSANEVRGESKDRNEELQEKLEAYNPAVQWGDRKAVATRIGAGEWGVKAEVILAEEAVRMVKRGLWWNKTRHEVELWSAARQRVSQNPSPTLVNPRQNSGAPTGPRNGSASRYQRSPTQMNTPMGYLGRSNVQCYACQKWGHFARVCNTNSRNTSARIGERGQKRPVPSANKAWGPVGKRPAAGEASVPTWAREDADKKWGKPMEGPSGNKYPWK